MEDFFTIECVAIPDETGVFGGDTLEEVISDGLEGSEELRDEIEAICGHNVITWEVEEILEIMKELLIRGDL